MRRTRPRVSMSPLSFSRPTTWIFRQSPRQRARHLRSARFSSTRARRNSQPVMSRSPSCGEISARVRRSFHPAEKSSPRFNPRIWTYVNARLELQMRDLRSEGWPHLEPATFDVTAEVVHDRLAIAGKLQQTRIQPLELNANMPFDIPKIAHAGKLPDETPITAKARLPRSPVNFVRQFLPALEALDGDVGLDVDVSGTIGNPVLSGAGDMR